MLELKNISLRRKGKVLLDQISLQIEPGKIIGIVGPNGAGKSSLLKILSGSLAPDEGEAALHNQNIGNWTHLERARCCALLSQKPTLAFDFNVKEIVALGRYPYRHLPLNINEEVIARYIGLLDLKALQNQLYSTLSGGEQQRVHLARLLAQIDHSATEHKNFLLLDEHMAHLDLTYQYLTFNYLKKIAGEGTGVVVVSHDIAILKKFADEVIVLNQGKLYKRGGPSEALSDEVLKQVFNIPFYPSFFNKEG
ncbi:MAG: transporter related [Gammaproteobacteria bacterium]|jgi:iron complex transport system ATP-binding protein|nr:transporter related [Gammaproteobacteria bacterium]